MARAPLRRHVMPRLMLALPKETKGTDEMGAWRRNALAAAAGDRPGCRRLWTLEGLAMSLYAMTTDPVVPPMMECGAGDEPRTRDLRLGKPALYQLSYARMARIVR